MMSQKTPLCSALAPLADTSTDANACEASKRGKLISTSLIRAPATASQDSHTLNLRVLRRQCIPCSFHYEARVTELHASLPHLVTLFVVV